MGSTAIPAEGSSRTHGNGHRARRCGAPATPALSAEFPPGAVGATVRAWPAASGFGCARPLAGAMAGRDVALYVDDAIWRWQGLQWAHLLADGIDELHRFRRGPRHQPAVVSGTTADLGPPL